MEGNYPGVIIWGTIIQAPIVQVAILLKAIVWKAIIQGAIILGSNCSGGNYPGVNCARTRKVRGGRKGKDDTVPLSMKKYRKRGSCEFHHGSVTI